MLMHRRKLDPRSMKTAVVVVVASFALAMGELIAPGSALGGHQAQGFHNTGPVVGGATLGTSRSVAVPFPDQPFVSRSFVRPFARSFSPFTVVTAAPAVGYAAPPVYYAPPAYYEPPASYSAPINYGPLTSYAPPRSPTVSVAPAPMPSVVQFPTGRYELRGDGVSMPHTWVWIPNPPTAAPPAAQESTSARPPTSRRSQLYRWTDAEGTMHWTDRLDAVPEQYLTNAEGGR
jgi:hypothetical protein